MASVDKVNRFCLDIIQKFTKCECMLDESDKFCYSLTVDKKYYPCLITSKDMHGKDVIVIPLNTDGYYIAFNISYGQKGQKGESYDIKDVSLQFYTCSEAIAKAEWMNYDYHNDADRSHPQPHWHLAPKIIMLGKNTEESNDQEDKTFEEIVQPTEDVLLEERVFQAIANNLEEQDKRNLDSIHYAMSGRWIEKEDDGRQAYDLTEKNLIRWLQRCLDSMAHQLEYIK